MWILHCMQGHKNHLSPTKGCLEHAPNRAPLQKEEFSHLHFTPG